MESKYYSLKLENQLCFPLYLCSKEIIKKYTSLLNKINLTYTQYIVMMYFWEKKSSNVKDISKTLLIDSSTLTPLLKKLESKGYIIRSKSSYDERNLDIKITNVGLKLQDKVLNIPDKVGKCINIDKKEGEILYKIIYKILMNVERND